MLLRALSICLAAAAPAGAQWREQDSGTRVSLRGVSAVSGAVAWASGADGTVLRTVDGGARWERVPTPPGADSLDFRDVHGVSATTAYVMSAGPGARSRIYKTTTGGRRWSLQHAGVDSAFFLDAIAFWDARRGIAMSDPVRGRFVVLTTDDGGARWTPVPADGMPAARPGEAGFAAGGVALAVGPGGRAWFGTGGGATRVFASADWGRSWRAVEAPLATGAPSRGVFGIAVVGATRLVAVGGDYSAPAATAGLAARSADAGATWQPVGERSGPRGYRSGIAAVPGTAGRIVIAVGTSGSDRSADGGATWQAMGDAPFNATSFATAAGGWAVGPDGRIGRYAPADPRNR